MRGQRAWLTDRLRSDSEHIIPVVGGGAKALNGWVQSHHGVGHVVAGRIGIIQVSVLTIDTSDGFVRFTQ